VASLNRHASVEDERLRALLIAPGKQELLDTPVACLLQFAMVQRQVHGNAADMGHRALWQEQSGHPAADNSDVVKVRPQC